MKRIGINSLAILISMLIFLSGCEVVEGIFKAGVWAGVAMVVIVIGIIIFIVTRIF